MQRMTFFLIGFNIVVHDINTSMDCVSVLDMCIVYKMN